MTTQPHLTLVPKNSIERVRKLARAVSKVEEDAQQVLRDLEDINGETPTKAQKPREKRTPKAELGVVPQVGEKVTYTGEGLSRKLQAGDQLTVKWVSPDKKYATVLRESDKFYTDIAVRFLRPDKKAKKTGAA